MCLCKWWSVREKRIKQCGKKKYQRAASTSKIIYGGLLKDETVRQTDRQTSRQSVYVCHKATAPQIPAERLEVM